MKRKAIRTNFPSSLLPSRLINYQLSTVNCQLALSSLLSPLLTPLPSQGRGRGGVLTLPLFFLCFPCFPCEIFIHANKDPFIFSFYLCSLLPAINLSGGAGMIFVEMTHRNNIWTDVWTGHLLFCVVTLEALYESITI